MELLNMEEECIGTYVSGHPLDDWREIIEKCATVSSSTIMNAAKETKAEKDAILSSGGHSWGAMKNAGRTYIAVGMLSGLRQIMTKTGTQMAFAKLSDFRGAMDITFFPKTWEALSSKIEDGKVYAFKGKADLRSGEESESASFLVDSMEDINTLKEKSIPEVHIKLNPSFSGVEDIAEIKEFLFGSQGNCSVYFHMTVGDSSYTIKANPQLKAPSSEEFLEQLKELSNIQDAWVS